MGIYEVLTLLVEKDQGAIAMKFPPDTMEALFSLSLTMIYLERKSWESISAIQIDHWDT